MLFFITLLTMALGHGRLTSPIPRFGTGDNNGAENGPTGNQDSDTWVCRHTRAENTQPILELTAGDTLNLQWGFTAAHVGDCAVFVTYEVDADRQTQKYFKIANLFDCRSQNNQNVPITLPDWLPAGDVTIRWDWDALHVWPSVEFYSQCIDARITASANAVPLSDIFTYTIPGVYPANGNTGVGYRNPFGSGAQYQTGPPCALNWSGNDCARTACGTDGFLDVRNAFTGRRKLGLTRRMLCADIKTSADCVAANNDWNMCTGSDNWWISQCQATCGQCQTTTAGAATTSSGNGGAVTTTSGVAAGCDAYAYDFNSGGNNNDNGDGDNNGNNNDGNGDNASAGMATFTALVFVMFVLI